MERPGRTRTALIVIAMLALIGGGSIFLQREVAETLAVALVLSLVWAGAVGGAFLLYARRRQILAPVLAGLAIGGLAAGIGFYAFAIADDTVDEDVVVATEAAAPAEAETGLAAASGEEREAAAGPITLAMGSFEGADGHSGRGTATVVQTGAGERKLTFTGFDVSRGAAVEVWLTPGPDETGDRIELGTLKGNVGDQQYEVPADADLNRYGTVVLYCTPFTVRIAVAGLETTA